MLKRNQRLQMLVCLVLVITMVTSFSFALGNQDEELEKKYAPILGEYEFDLSEFGADVIILKFHIDSEALWGDSGDGAPITLEPAGDELYEFTSDDPDSGALEIKFLKDDEGQYTLCQVAILDQGVEIIGTKIKQ